MRFGERPLSQPDNPGRLTDRQREALRKIVRQNNPFESVENIIRAVELIEARTASRDTKLLEDVLAGVEHIRFRGAASEV